LLLQQKLREAGRPRRLYFFFLLAFFAAFFFVGIGSPPLRIGTSPLKTLGPIPQHIGCLLQLRKILRLLSGNVNKNLRSALAENLTLCSLLALVLHRYWCNYAPPRYTPTHAT